MEAYCGWDLELSELRSIPGDTDSDAAARPARTARAWRSQCACMQVRRAAAAAEHGDMVTMTGRRGLAECVGGSPFAMMPGVAGYLTRLAGGVERQEDALYEAQYQC